jgi:TnpA family transposase
MPSISETAYPRIKINPSEKELIKLYTPTKEETYFAHSHTRSLTSKLGLLILLKTFQTLGRFVSFQEVPPAIISHIASSVGIEQIPDGILTYDTTGTRTRHIQLLRNYFSVRPYGNEARRCMVKAAVEASKTRSDLVDIINVAIEELIRQYYELPAFNTLLRAARTSRAIVNRGYHQLVYNSLDDAARSSLDRLLKRSPGETRSLWDRIKREPNHPTTTHIKEFIDHLHWLEQHNIKISAFDNIPPSKIQHFAAEARSLDLSSMNDLQETKRFTLTAALVREQVARAYDDVAEMFIKRVQRMHNKAREALTQYQSQTSERTDSLINLLRETVHAYKSEGTKDQRFDAMETIIGANADYIIEQCDAHIAFAGSNYFPFLPQFYKNVRHVFFNFIESVKLISTNQDQSVEKAIDFLIAHRHLRSNWLPTTKIEKTDEGFTIIQLVDISWITDKWWKLVTNKPMNGEPITKVDRRYFELCLFTQIMQELKSGDLCIPGSERFNDYREQLISWDEYNLNIKQYGKETGISIGSKAFIEELRQQLISTAKLTDEAFPDNEHIRIENGEPVLSKLNRKSEPDGLKRLEQLLKERIGATNVIDILADTEHWLGWTRFFGPISGLDAKLDNPQERYLTATFCYGCNLGPVQTARSIKGLDRKHVAFVNQRHVTEKNINDAIALVINAYNSFALQKIWGSGKTASADGTKWELYEENLMSEYHIRYGGYGGIGYYLISDSYIALFSRFTACGAWEGHYILDFVTENDSEVQPDTIHADTQGQNAPIFGLSHLLGIELMPRIRNWKKLHFYRPDPNIRYKHIDELFTEQIDWELIETHLPDMLRVALSVKAGKITPSAILRRLGTYSRKNKLYFAFRELGRVIRTLFLLRYISEIDIRRQILTATNRSESFNKFLQWVFFGGGGVISENIRDEQVKIIKYNHLVANLLIFHTMVKMTKAIREIVMEGHEVTEECLAAISPYQQEHINRFGTYSVNLNRIPEPVEYEFAISN